MLIYTHCCKDEHNDGYAYEDVQVFLTRIVFLDFSNINFDQMHGYAKCVKLTLICLSSDRL